MHVHIDIRIECCLPALLHIVLCLWVSVSARRVAARLQEPCNCGRVHNPVHTALADSSRLYTAAVLHIHSHWHCAGRRRGSQASSEVRGARRGPFVGSSAATHAASQTAAQTLKAATAPAAADLTVSVFCLLIPGAFPLALLYAPTSLFVCVLAAWQPTDPLFSPTQHRGCRSPSKTPRQPLKQRPKQRRPSSARHPGMNA